MTQAIILAAGSGERLRPVANGTPKCLVSVGGRPLIEHQLDILHHVGIERVAVVVGYEAESVRERLRQRCHVIANERYFETNSLYSLWLARNWVDGPFLLMNSDILAHPDIYFRVLAVQGTALAFDSSSELDDEEMKVRLSRGFVRSISKELPPMRAHGENVGIVRFDDRGSSLMLEEADKLIAAGSVASWAPAAVHSIARKIRIRAVDVAGLPWTEIDFPQDLHRAQRMVWPLIEGGRWTLAESSGLEGETNGSDAAGRGRRKPLIIRWSPRGGIVAPTTSRSAQPPVRHGSISGASRHSTRRNGQSPS
jgi:choline kinase